ncbi:MAG: hypothetical protein LBT54_04320 [Bifidobacteriaceae bacterium]|nr:hypothetical protein [Bifidobacteriaceae bacterium]
MRTFANTLAASIPTGGIAGVAISGGNLMAMGWGMVAAVMSSFLAGLAAFLRMVASGVPEAYAVEAFADAEAVEAAREEEATAASS